MIPIDYVTFETAMLLKEAGFPQDKRCCLFYNKYGQDWHFADGYIGNGYAKPTQAQAMRWLRENLKIHIEIDYTKYNGWEYTLLLDYDTDKSRMGFSVGTDTYETAVENAIQAVCNYLIEKGGEQ